MDAKTQISLNLRFLCAEIGPVSQICREIGINRQQFDRYIKGLRLPSAHNLRRISSYFQVPEQYLFLEHTNFLSKYEETPNLPDDAPAGVLTKTFAKASKQLKRYIGYYHVFVTSPSWEGRILQSLTHLHEKDGFVVCKTIQKATSRDGEIRQRARFNGLVSYRGNRIFIVEAESGDEGSVVETVLFSAHRQQVNYLRGLTLGVASRPRFTPYVSKTVWKRISERTLLREALASCGAYDKNSRIIDPTVRKFLDSPAELLHL